MECDVVTHLKKNDILYILTGIMTGKHAPTCYYMIKDGDAYNLMSVEFKVYLSRDI